VGKITQIGKGASLEVTFDRDGESIEGWVATLYVKQHVKDVTTTTPGATGFNRVIPPGPDNNWPTLITAAETAVMNLGLWNAFARLVNTSTNEERQIRNQDIRFQVQEAIDP